MDSSEKVIAENKGPGLFHLVGEDKLPFVDADSVNSRFKIALQRSIENLDEELAKFENHFSTKHSAIFWASTYDDVFNGLKKLFKNYKVKSVRLPNVNSSIVFRELGIKYFLRDEKIDLKDDADMQFFAADMLFSDTGSILLMNQSNNVLAKLSNSTVNIFFCTIEKILNNTEWVEIFQQMASYNNGGQRQDMILYKGGTYCDNYLFIIDNQRSCILREPELRQSLTCLNCGRCKDVCPVFQTIGETPYNNVFSGPLANVTLPFLETIETYKHVAFACTFCGHCEEVCPLHLPVRDMIVGVRHKLLSEGLSDKKHRRLISAIRKFVNNRNKMNSSSFLKQYMLSKYVSSDLRKTRKLPPFSKESFNKSFRNK